MSHISFLEGIVPGIEQEAWAMDEIEIVIVAAMQSQGGYHTLGSVEGHLERINWHGNRSFTIWDRVTGAPVGVYFDADREQDVIRMAKRVVVVTGLVRHFSDGTPRSITDLVDILPIDDFEPPVVGTFGSIPDFTNGLDSVEYVKAGR